MGLAYYWQEEYDKSIEFYQKAINLNAKNDLYYVGIGNSERYNENYESAIEWYRKALATGLGSTLGLTASSFGAGVDSARNGVAL